MTGGRTPTPDDVRARNIVDAMMAKDAFSRWLGVEVLDAAAGRAVIRMTVRPEMVNGFDVCHGGITFSFADSAFAFASNGRGRLALAIDTSISFPAKVMPGDVLTATAEELSLTNRLGVYRVVVANQDDAIVGAFRGTVYRTSQAFSRDGSLDGP